MRWISIALIMLLTAGSLAAQEIGIETIEGTVDGTTNVRSGPDPRFEIVGQLQAGDRVQIDGRESAAGRWLHITLIDGIDGWIPAFTVIPDADLSELPILAASDEGAAGANVRVDAYGRVNVRAAPSIDSEIVGQLDVGDQAAVIARNSAQNDWLLIRLLDIEGWVAYFTVNVTGDPARLPILVPDSSGAGLIPPSVLIRTLFNARLHTEPTLTSPVVVTVPFNSDITPIARSERGDWLYVGYDGIEGWGVARLFQITPSQIEALPVGVAALDVTPAVTPRS